MNVLDFILLAVIAAAIVGAFFLNRYRKSRSGCCSGGCSSCSGCGKSSFCRSMQRAANAGSSKRAL